MKQHTINIYCENKVGIITKITLIFTRRRINIDSFTASKTEIENVYKITLVTSADKEKLEKIIKHIEKIIEVYRAFLLEDDQIIRRQIGLFKIGRNDNQKALFDNILEKNQAKIVHKATDFYIVEKTGLPEELNDLLADLDPFNLIEYAASGRVAIVKWSKKFHQHLINLSKEKEEIYI